jgi:hypothetical protein
MAKVGPVRQVDFTTSGTFDREGLHPWLNDNLGSLGLQTLGRCGFLQTTALSTPWHYAENPEEIAFEYLAFYL